MIEFIYIINNNFYKKYIKKEFDNNYLPFFDNNNKNEIIDKKIIIYVKSIGFVGLFNVINIIDENNDLFNKLTLSYNLGTSTNLCFMEIKNITLLKEIFKYRDYINYCKLNKINYINYSKSNDLYISKNFSDFFDNISENLDNENDNLDNENDNLDNENDNLNNENDNLENDNLENENNNLENINFKIPILWIPCINLLELVEKKKINKKVLKNHFNNCSKCENNNNNKNFQFNFDNYKNKINLINHFSILNYYNYYNDPINIAKYKLNNKNEENISDKEYSSEEYLSDDDFILDEEDNKRDILIEKIVTSYSTSINYGDTLENLKLIGIDDNMTNILYYNNINEDHVYNNTLFIIK